MGSRTTCQHIPKIKNQHCIATPRIQRRSNGAFRRKMYVQLIDTTANSDTNNGTDAVHHIETTMPTTKGNADRNMGERETALKKFGPAALMRFGRAAPRK